MKRQLTREDLLNAKAIHLYDEDTIYVELNDTEDVYGSYKGGEWFVKGNFWDYFESSEMLSFFRMLTAQEALEILGRWRNEGVERAIIFATEKHRGQLRKSTDIPYIMHPIEVMQILYSMNADKDLLIAGVLHDTLEDTDTTIDEIRELFGENVARLVASNSEDKSKTWKERKQHTIDELAKAPLEVKMLVMADKLSNSRSIATDYARIGDELWSRFNASKEMQAWYYSGVQDSLFGMQAIPECESAYWELVHLFKRVFVKFYYDAKNQRIYQVCVDGTGYYMQKGIDDWRKLSAETAKAFCAGEIPEGVIGMEQYYAEKLEESWSAMYDGFADSHEKTILQ